MIAVSTLLKSCAMPPASWPIACIFWLWAKFSCSVALLGRVEREDDRARPFVARRVGGRDEQARRPRGLRALERRRRAARSRPLPSAAAARAARSAAVVALGDQAEDRGLAVAAGGFQRRGRETGEGGVGAEQRAVGPDLGDGDRRRVEDAREADLGGAQILLALGLAGRAADHQRARRAGQAVAGERDLVQDAAPAAPGPGAA